MPGASTTKWAFLNKYAQFHLKPASAFVVKTWEVLVPICRIPTTVMENGHQKSKGLSYMAKLKREAVQCTEKRNRKAAAIFGVDESNVELWTLTRGNNW
jgi:hypothetical protein